MASYSVVLRLLVGEVRCGLFLASALRFVFMPAYSAGSTRAEAVFPRRHAWERRGCAWLNESNTRAEQQLYPNAARGRSDGPQEKLLHIFLVCYIPLDGAKLLRRNKAQIDGLDMTDRHESMAYTS